VDNKERIEELEQTIREMLKHMEEAFSEGLEPDVMGRARDLIGEPDSIDMQVSEAIDMIVNLFQAEKDGGHGKG
jgi:hypothetical protein